MPLLVEMGWDGLVQVPDYIQWTDITQHVDTVQGVNITRGASDELAETQPGTCTLTLDNSDGRFTPGNSSSPYYPYVRRNAPIRVAVAVIPQRTGSAPWPLAQLGDDFDDGQIDTSKWATVYGGTVEVGGRARIPVAPGVNAGLRSAQSYSLAGSQVAAKLATAPAANGSSSGAASMWVHSTTAGTRVGWLFNPATQMLFADNQVGFGDAGHPSFPYSPIEHAWLRVRETGGTVYWETSGDGREWTVRRSVATPSWVTSQSHAFEFTGVRTGGSADYIEWDLLGADVRPRFYGMVNEFPVSWAGLYSTVQISCTDLFKRLNRQTPLKSMLAQEILEGIPSRPLAYYPLTEDSAAASAGDISGNAASSLAITQVSSGGTLEMGGATGPAETGDQHPLFTSSSATAGKYLTTNLGTTLSQTSGYLAFECWFQGTTTTRAAMGLYSTDLQKQIVLSVSSLGSLQLEWTDVGGSLTVETVSGTSAMTDGNWHHVVFDELAESVWVDGTLRDSSVFVYPGTTLQQLHVGGYRGSRMWNGSVGHIVLYAATGGTGAALAQHYAAGATGFAGEAADERIQRLARYAGLNSVTVFGVTHDPVASQGPGGSSVVTRMREIEATESARLWAERDYYGLAYQSRDVRYNPSPGAETFTISYADLEPGIVLADDDQKMVNLVEASRPGGATQRVTAASSIDTFGEYPQDLTVLKTTDNAVLDAASWTVSRYADPQPELREVPIEAYTLDGYLDILDAEIGSYFSVTSLPAQATAPTMRVTVEGYTETIKHNSHTVTFHTSASSTDSVWVLGDAVYGVLGTTTRLAY
jgi:hypothetical protein